MKTQHPKKTIVAGAPCFETARGAAFLGDAADLLRKLPEDSVDLVLTSPPYALHFKKEYGNVDQREYVDWLLSFVPEIRRVMKPKGSFVLNVGGSWTPGTPTRALCHLELPIRIVREHDMYLAQEFFWYNPAKLPAPAEWVNVRKFRVKDAVECVWWLSKDPFPKADNQQVLQPYSPDMHRLLRRGYRATTRPSGHIITEKFTDRGGSIPGNLLSMGNNDANSRYFSRCSETGVRPHPARFPPQLPAFFLNFLTVPGDLVVDPFAGSCTTGEVAENLGRRWLCFDMEASYLDGGRFRFEVPWDDDRRAQVTGGVNGDAGGVVGPNPSGAQQTLPFDRAGKPPPGQGLA